jgi:hypothetical protein
MRNLNFKISNLRFLPAFIGVHLWFLSGCSNSHPTTQPVSAADRQDAALRDPFGYKPDMSDANDISGGRGIGAYDRKAMRKDLDHVLNP